MAQSLLTEFTLFWLDGKREVVKGNNVADAFRRAGYGGGAMRALDFTANGDDKNWSWDGKKWHKSTVAA